MTRVKNQPGRIVQLNVSQGGVPKTMIEAGEINETGFTTDKQRNRRYHGGPSRAVCLFPIEHIRRLNEAGHPIRPGDIGENITTEGIDWSLMVPGSRWRLGDGVEIEMTSYTVPCKNISYAFLNGEITLVSQKVNPGWSRTYARVLNGGSVKAGDPIVYLGKD